MAQNPTISKMETTQTAVEWLDEQLQDKMFIQYGYGTGIKKIVIPVDYYMEFIKQAKQMEKQQIKKAFSDGQQTPMNHPTLPHYSNEEYYNENYYQNKG